MADQRDNTQTKERYSSLERAVEQELIRTDFATDKKVEDFSTGNPDLGASSNGQSRSSLKKVTATPWSEKKGGQARQIEFVDSEDYENFDSEAEDRLQEHGETFEATTLKNIKQAHELWRLESRQCESQREYMNKVMYSVPLNQLYEVQASCGYTENSAFCPVLIKINDNTIRTVNQNKRFLLQVWARGGTMLFERPMRRPVANWNLSGDKFLFQEDPTSREVYLVKLFQDRQPFVFKFMLPESVAATLSNSAFLNSQSASLLLNQSEMAASIELTNEDGLAERRQSQPSEDVSDVSLPLKQEKNPARGVRQARVQPSQDPADVSESNSSKRSVSELFSSKLVTRVPERMIDYQQGFVLLAQRDKIICLDVSKHNLDEPPSQSPQLGGISKACCLLNVTSTDEEVSVLSLHEGYRIVCIEEISSAFSCVVLEDCRTFQLRFMRVTLEQGPPKRVKLVQMGLLANASSLEKSPLLKYRAVTKVDQDSGNSYQVGLGLRMNGRVEVYNDFMLANEIYDANEQCVDIDADFNQFHLRIVENSAQITASSSVSDLKIALRQVRHLWRNKIGFSTTKRKHRVSKWEDVTGLRVASHVRLYSQILSFALFTLVSHRNMISVFSMRNQDTSSEGKWVDTFSFSHDHIRNMFIKKRTKKALLKGATSPRTGAHKDTSIYGKYEIVILIGTHTVRYTHITYQGELARHGHSIKAPGRILKIANDKYHKCGVLMLTDNGKRQADYLREQGNKIYSFPLQQQQSTPPIRLHSLKAQEFHLLLKSSESAALAYDSNFCVMNGYRSTFENQIDDFQVEDDLEDEVKTAFVDESIIRAVSVCSYERQAWQLIPLVLERGAGVDNKSQIKLHLVKNKLNWRDVEASGLNSRVLQTFFVTGDSIPNARGCLVQVSEKSLCLYNKDLQLTKRIVGLNMKQCVLAQQRYLYSISDRITEPYSSEDLEQGGEPVFEQNWKYSAEGMYVYDLQRLFMGHIEKYKLCSGVGGMISLIDSSKFTQRLTSVLSFRRISVIPFPHLNIISCIGMGSKNDYLIWRESKGFFSALDKHSNLITWSLASGKLLYSEPQTEDAAASQMLGYKVYHADEDDITYSRDFFNQDDASINLLQSETPICQEQRKYELDPRINQDCLRESLKLQQSSNELGTDGLLQTHDRLEDQLFVSDKRDTLVTVKNGLQASELYHFKVMQLRTHEDTLERSQCQLRFHFLFPLVSQVGPEAVSMDSSGGFKWEIAAAPVQRLYLSKNTRRLMEVKNNEVAIVYERHDLDSKSYTLPKSLSKNISSGRDVGQQVEWLEAFKLKRYPSQLASLTSVPYMFSPDFNYQLDFNYRGGQFRVRETRTQAIYLDIGKDLIDTSWGNQSGGFAIKMICSRVRWESERRLRIVNQQNLDCIFEMRSTDPEDKDRKKRYLHLLSVTKVDNLVDNTSELDCPHLLSQQSTLGPESVLERLIRTNQRYKTSLQHALNTGDRGFDLLMQLTRIDYLQPWNSLKSSFDVENAFTWLDWLIFDQSNQDQHYALENETAERKVQMCFNIFPKGRGVLHHLANTQSRRANGFTNLDDVQAFFPTREFFETACSGELERDYEVPILQDMYGQTPLHICLSLPGQTYSESSIFKPLPKSATVVVKGKKNKRENLILANLILDSIKDYGLCHSSHQIMDTLIAATERSVPSLKAYLDARMIKASHPQLEQSQCEIRTSKSRSCPGMQGEYGLMLTDVFMPVSNLESELFRKSTAKQPMSLQQVDLPFIYNRTPQGIEFLDALTACEDLQFFGLKSVQILIDNHAKFWNRISFLFVGLPMTIQLASFWYWSNFVLPEMTREGDNSFDGQHDVCRVLLGLTSLYLLLIESSAIYVMRLEYLKAPTLLFNIITPLLICTNIFRSNFEEDSFWRVQMWAALVVWFRFLLYLRTTLTFSWLIRMITECILDMATFIVVLFIGIVAFADAFQSIEKQLIIRGSISQPEPDPSADWYEQHVQRYTEALKNSFLTALGEFDSNIEFYERSDWLIFILCCIFNIILLLNLLIAIISETYTRISESSVQTGYREKALQMRNFQKTFLGLLGKKKPDPCELIFIAQQIRSGDMEDAVSDEVLNRVDDLSEQVEQIQSSLAVHIDDRFQRLSLFLNDRGEKGKDNDVSDTTFQRANPPQSATIKSLFPHVNTRTDASAKDAGFVPKHRVKRSQDIDNGTGDSENAKQEESENEESENEDIVEQLIRPAPTKSSKRIKFAKQPSLAEVVATAALITPPTSNSTQNPALQRRGTLTQANQLNSMQAMASQGKAFPSNMLQASKSIQKSYQDQIQVQSKKDIGEVFMTKSKKRRK